MEKIEFVGLKQQRCKIMIQLQKRIDTVLTHGQFINGPEVAELEQELKRYHPFKHVITCGSGTDALVLALKAMGIVAGNLVITTPFSFTATTESIFNAGALPIFVDINNNFELNVKDIKDLPHRDLIKAILPVSLYGKPVITDELVDFAKDNDIPILEDGAQSFGVEGCLFGDVATTSFFPSKMLGCYGDGGAVFTNDDSIAAMVRSLKNHGTEDDKYFSKRIGMNSRLDTIQASILLAKLEVFDQEMEDRQRLSTMYNYLIDDTDLVTKGHRKTLATYNIYSDRRDELQTYLYLKGIPTMIYYPYCIDEMLPIRPINGTAKKISRTILSIPFHPYLSQRQAEYIATTINEAKI